MPKSSALRINCFIRIGLGIAETNHSTRERNELSGRPDHRLEINKKEFLSREPQKKNPQSNFRTNDKQKIKVNVNVA
jgi:hypothetical protein